MSLEDVLKVMENAKEEYRNPEKYYFSIFGTPAPSGTWGYRVEGHHLSQNYTVTNGEVICAPSFFGSNPAEVASVLAKVFVPWPPKTISALLSSIHSTTINASRHRHPQSLRRYPDLRQTCRRATRPAFRLAIAENEEPSA